MNALPELLSNDSSLAANISEWRNTDNTTESINISLSFENPFGKTSRKFYDKLYCINILMIFIFGAAGNALTFAIFNVKKNKKRSFSVYMRALALSDSVVLLNETFNQWLTRFVDIRIIYGDDQICLLFLAWVDSWLNFSAILLTLISLDRYIAFVYPLKRDFMCTYSRAVRVTMVAVIFSVGLNFGVFFLWTNLERDAEKRVPNWKDPNWSMICPSMFDSKNVLVHQILTFVFVLFIPFWSILVLNLRVLFVVRRAMQRKQETAFLAMIKATLPVLTLTISSAFIIFPLLAILILDFIIADISPDTKDQIDGVFASSNLCLKFNYAINFYIFVFAKNYRDSLKEVFCNCMPSAPNIPRITGSTSDLTA